jgi:hypothetical protein
MSGKRKKGEGEKYLNSNNIFEVIRLQFNPLSPLPSTVPTILRD